MSVIGVGMDLVEVERARHILSRHGERALNRFLLEPEREYVMRQADPAPHFAVRVAAKEAAYKALSGDELAHGIGWRDIEVERMSDGRPVLRLHGKAAERFKALGAKSSHLSLTHAGGVAGAVVVIE